MASKASRCTSGATGSIGVSTLDVIALHPGRYEVFALTAFQKVEALAGTGIDRVFCLQFNRALRGLSAQAFVERVLRGARGPGGGLPDALLDQLADDPAVVQAVGVIEIDTYARAEATATKPRSTTSKPCAWPNVARPVMPPSTR